MDPELILGISGSRIISDVNELHSCSKARGKKLQECDRQNFAWVDHPADWWYPSINEPKGPQIVPGLSRGHCHFNRWYLEEKKCWVMFSLISFDTTEKKKHLGHEFCNFITQWRRNQRGSASLSRKWPCKAKPVHSMKGVQRVGMAT